MCKMFCGLAALSLLSWLFAGATGSCLPETADLSGDDSFSGFSSTSWFLSTSFAEFTVVDLLESTLLWADAIVSSVSFLLSVILLITLVFVVGLPSDSSKSKVGTDWSVLISELELVFCQSVILD